MTVDKKMDRDDRLLAAEYALGVLPHAERQRFSARLEQEPDLRAEVDVWEGHFEPLTNEIEATPPPPAMYGLIEQRLFGASSTPATPKGLWSSIGFWRGLAFASLVAIAVMASLLFATLRPTDAPEGTYVANLSGETNLVQLVALYEASSGQLRLNRTKGEAAAERDFELWLIEGDNAPISLGVLPREAHASLQVPAALRAKMPGGVLAISDEPAGGSPTGQATGPVLAVGAISQI